MGILKIVNAPYGAVAREINYYIDIEG